MGGRHHSGGGEGEGGHVAHEHHEAIAREAAHKEEPDEDPHHVERGVGRHHGAYAERPDAHHQGDGGHAEAAGAPEVYVGTAFAQHRVAQHRVQRHHRSAHAQYLQQLGRGQPLFCYGYRYELFGNKRY